MAPPPPNPAFGGTVFTIVMENHSAEEILGSKSAPFINSLAAGYAVAGDYYGESLHPSLPNYIWMVAGENFDVATDNPPPREHIACRSHLADQIERIGLSWRSYQESMGTPCNLQDSYPYAPKHNPFVYFDDVIGWNGSAATRPARCTDHVVDYAEFGRDLQQGTLPYYAFITPDLGNDMHDGSIADGDAWLAREVPKILAAPAFTNGGVLFLAWDEGSTVTHENPPFLVVSPHARKGFVSNTHYTTSSFLKTVQALLGVEALPCDPYPDTVPTMDDLFTVPLTLGPRA